MLRLVVEFLAAACYAVDVDFLEPSVVVERHAGVQEQIAVAYLVETAAIEQEVHVTRELLATAKRVGEVVHDRALLLGEPVGVVRIDGREVVVGKLVGHAIDVDGSRVIVDEMQELSALKSKTRILIY